MVKDHSTARSKFGQLIRGTVLQPIPKLKEPFGAWYGCLRSESQRDLLRLVPIEAYPSTGKRQEVESLCSALSQPSRSSDYGHDIPYHEQMLKSAYLVLNIYVLHT
jgi:hypothetical protein